MSKFFNKEQNKTYLRYLYALLAVPITVSLQYAIIPIVGNNFSYITLIPMAVVVALLAGMWPAVLTCILGSIAIDYFFLPPLLTLEINFPAFARIIIVTLVSMFVGYIGEKLRKARAKAEEQTCSLRESESRLELALGAAKQATWELNLLTNEVIASRKMRELYGINEEGFNLRSQSDWRAFVLDEDLSLITDAMDNAAVNGGTFDVEYRIQRQSDKTKRWIESHGQIINDTDGHAAKIVGVLRDITDRKKTEEALSETTKYLENLLNYANAPIICWDTNLKITRFNHAFERLTGYDANEVLEKDLSLLFPEDSKTESLEKIKRSLTEYWETVEIPILRKDGSVRIALWNSANVYEENGKTIQATIAQGQDITERKSAVEALQKTNERLRLLSEISGRLLLTDRPQKIMSDLCVEVMNHLGCQVFFNYLAEKSGRRLRLNACAGITDDEKAKIEWLDYGVAICGCVARDGKCIIAEDVQNSGDERTSLVKRFGIQAYACHPLVAGQDVIGTLSFGTTKRKNFKEDEISLMKTVADQLSIAMERIRTAKKIQENEARLKRAQEIALLGSWELDLRTDRLEWSEEVYRIFGIKDEEFGSNLNSFLGMVHPDDRVAVEKAFSDSLKEGADSYEIEHRIINQTTGEIRMLHERCRHLRDAQGRAVRSVGMVHDITERKRLEEELRSSRDVLEARVRERTADLYHSNVQLHEEIQERTRAEAAVQAEQKRFHDVLDDLPVYVILLTPDYFTKFANRNFIERFGESKGRKCYEFLFDRKEPCEMCETYKVLNTLAPHRWQWTGPDGRVYDVSDFPFTDADGSTLILEMGLDITEQKRAQDALRVLAKKVVDAQEEERQRISRELHDDICQRLSAAKLHMEALEEIIPKSDRRIRQKLSSIRRQMTGSIGEVRRISANLRPSSLDDLGFVTALRLLCEVFEKENSIKVRFIARGVDAISAGENVEIALYRIVQEALSNVFKHANATEVLITLMLHNNLLSLIVNDNGKGIDFTKQTGRKDYEGFGLTGMKERMHLIGGKFNIKSTRGKGTEIRVDIPQNTEATDEKN